MKYGLPYKEVIFNTKAQVIVNKVISYRHRWTRGQIVSGTKSNRSSEIAWLGDRELLAMLLRMIKKINEDARWNLKITGVEPVQYGRYGEGDFYDWHIDEHAQPINGNVPISAPTVSPQVSTTPVTSTMSTVSFINMISNKQLSVG